jgi:hypothetical protein
MQLSPAAPEYRVVYGLACADVGDAPSALQAISRLELPEESRTWKALAACGLAAAHAQMGNVGAALDALATARAFDAAPDVLAWAAAKLPPDIVSAPR